MCTSRSKTASSSLRSVDQCATAASQSAPCGACGRPARKSKVVWSGAISPARAPASIDMLQIVIRASIERASMALPRYSMTWPAAPLVPIFAMTARMTSFEDTPSGSTPSTVTAICLGRYCGRVCVASTCSTSLVPMPNASAPNAPCVEVCESPQTTVSPGIVSPSCGPTTCTMPWSASPRECRRSEEHTSELQSRQYLVCRLLLEKKKNISKQYLICQVLVLALFHADPSVGQCLFSHEHVLHYRALSHRL